MPDELPSSSFLCLLMPLPDRRPPLTNNPCPPLPSVQPGSTAMNPAGSTTASYLANTKGSGLRDQYSLVLVNDRADETLEIQPIYKYSGPSSGVALNPCFSTDTPA